VQSSPPPSSSTRPKPTALVIDDSEIARARLAELLDSAGFKVVQLPSPIGATRVVLEHRVSVVLIDILMPAMRGDRLAKLFRGHRLMDRVGVILVSGESSLDLEQLVNESGADAAVSKSSLEQLLPTVRRVLMSRPVRCA
jgi:PleD family two-component response regulator